MTDCCDYVNEKFIWAAGCIEGFVIGLFIGYEKKHHKHRKEHDFIDEMEKGFEVGFMEGLWTGDL